MSNYHYRYTRNEVIAKALVDLVAGAFFGLALIGAFIFALSAIWGWSLIMYQIGLTLMTIMLAMGLVTLASRNQILKWMNAAIELQKDS